MFLSINLSTAPPRVTKKTSFASRPKIIPCIAAPTATTSSSSSGLTFGVDLLQPSAYGSFHEWDLKSIRCLYISIVIWAYVWVDYNDLTVLPLWNHGLNSG